MLCQRSWRSIPARVAKYLRIFPKILALAKIPRFAKNLPTLFLGSSAVEQATVNRLVAGSIPAQGAISLNPHIHHCSQTFRKPQ